MICTRRTLSIRNVSIEIIQTEFIRTFLEKYWRLKVLRTTRENLSIVLTDAGIVFVYGYLKVV